MSHSSSPDRMPAPNTGIIIQQMKQAVAGGQHWYLALLEAMKAWTVTEEARHGRRYRYLIDNEAFDWLLLAERLCEEIESQLPDAGKTALLFYSQPLLKLSELLPWRWLPL